MLGPHPLVRPENGGTALPTAEGESISNRGSLRATQCAGRGRRASSKEQAALAQLVEHIIRNDGVACSSHASGTTSLTRQLSRILPKSRKHAAHAWGTVW